MGDKFRIVGRFIKSYNL